MLHWGASKTLGWKKFGRNKVKKNHTSFVSLIETTLPPDLDSQGGVASSPLFVRIAPFPSPLLRMAEPQTKSQQSTDKVTGCFDYCHGKSKAGIAKCIESCLKNNLAGKRSCFITVISLQCTYTSSPSKCGFGCVDPGEKPCDRPGGLIT